MTEMNQEQLESLRERFPQGTRIQCLENRDGVFVPTGENGTLEHIDELGLLHCDLDDGRRFIASIDEGCFRVIPSEKPEQCRISEITKDTFWTLIAQAKEHPGSPGKWLMEQLVDMGPEQAKKFDDIAHAYIDLSDQYGLWTAASVIERGGCTDDGFIDFRTWLVAQGKDVYMAALRDPDSLADAPDYQNSRFDTLPRMGDLAYEELTGRNTYEDFEPDGYGSLKEELKRDIEYGDGIEYPYDTADVPAYLPRLCRKYMPEDMFRKQKVDIGTWNLNNPNIQKARAAAQKSRKVQNRGDAR